VIDYHVFSQTALTVIDSANDNDYSSTSLPDSKN